MAWQRHASVDDHAVIRRGPTDPRFEHVATALMIQAAKYAFKAKLPRQEQAAFGSHWRSFQIVRRRSGAGDGCMFVEDHIRDVVRDADHALAGPGASATQWMTDHVNEIAHAVQEHFQQR